ncbi:MAG: rSAM/selenodomain-associated transferase 1 [Bradymonadia bacterium]
MSDGPQNERSQSEASNSAQKLMIFAKSPAPGRVKTRLAPAIGEAGAARLHTAFVRDVVARHDTLARALTVWRAGDLAHPLWAELGVDLATQCDGDLGDRLAGAFATELADGSAVVVLGTDSPTLPQGLVDRAFADLQTHPVVLGPACDGGYYLIGVRGAVPPVFKGIDWGTESVFAQTVEALNAAGIEFAVLPYWYDVDRPDDLRMLRAMRARLPDPQPAHTLAALAELDE